jgi:hypothetical protein
VWRKVESGDMIIGKHKHYNLRDEKIILAIPTNSVKKFTTLSD